ELDAKLGAVLAKAAQTLIKKSGVDPKLIRAIGSHGQTVCHLPDADPRGTLQIGDPAQIVEQTGITGVADLRHRDMAAGGQGAPLAPAFHAAYLRGPAENRCVLNLGGIANLSVLPADLALDVRGFDTGPANALMDLWALENIGEPFDRGGQWASTGNAIEPLLRTWLEDPFFSRPPPKSTGRDYFNPDWFQRHLQEIYDPKDIQATLAEFTAQSVADAIDRYASDTDAVLVCGGGVENDYLMDRLADCCGNRRVESTARYGVDPRWMEAMLVAWVAARTLSGLSGNLPAVTGAAGERICGAIYPA
ncbi:MAG: anhydro-N-acetylmuramic acid kinase, partial [Pseudomonadota bacterium]